MDDERLDDREKEEIDDSQNAVSTLLENFELPDIGNVKDTKFALKMDARVKISRKLTASDSGLMGEANKLFAQGKIDDAIRLTLEVIRNCPGNHQPYELLKTIVEDNGFKQDKETWIDLAEESRQMGDPGWENIAIWCYRNAYRQSGDGNLKIMIGNLYLKTEQWTLALSSFKEALKYLPPELGNEALKESFYFE